MSPLPTRPAYVTRYDYKGRVVYYVAPRCHVIFSDLYDVNGLLLAHPDGGIAGQGDGRAADFFDARGNEVFLWEIPDAEDSDY